MLLVWIQRRGCQTLTNNNVLRGDSKVDVRCSKTLILITITCTKFFHFHTSKIVLLKSLCNKLQVVLLTHHMQRAPRHILYNQIFTKYNCAIITKKTELKEVNRHG